MKRPPDLDACAALGDPIAQYALALERQQPVAVNVDDMHFELSPGGHLLFARPLGFKRLVGIRTRLGWDLSVTRAPLPLVNQAIAALKA